jgi:hypothetical protein
MNPYDAIISAFENLAICLDNIAKVDFGKVKIRIEDDDDDNADTN